MNSHPLGIMMLNLVAVLTILIVGTSCVFGQDIVLEGPRVTEWGVWGDLQLCPPLSYVYGMRLKVESDQGFFGDDTALNGIELLCLSAGAKRELREEKEGFATITSTVGDHGNYGVIMECPDPGFAVGFQLRSEKDQGALDDDTAANNLRLFCSGGAMNLEGYGHGWGDWTSEVRCPRGLQLCGIQTQVEGPNGDESALNNVNMACCA